MLLHQATPPNDRQPPGFHVFAARGFLRGLGIEPDGLQVAQVNIDGSMFSLMKFPGISYTFRFRDTSLTDIRSYCTPPKVKPKTLLTQAQARAQLDKWAKAFVVEGYVERRFSYAMVDGASEMVWDRKVGNFWLDAPRSFALDTRTGRFLDYHYDPVAVGATKVKIDAKAAEKIARAAPGGPEHDHGAHRLVSANLVFARRPGRLVADLSYELIFQALRVGDRMFPGTTVWVNAETGALTCPPRSMASK